MKSKELDEPLGEEGLFSPVKRSYLRMFLTLIYFILLAGTIIFLIFYFLYRFKTSSIYGFETSFLRSLDYLIDYFLEGGLILLISLPLALTIVIHKSFLKGLLTLVGLFIVYVIVQGGLFIVYVIVQGVGLITLALILLLLFLVGITSLGILARGFCRIRYKWIKILILIIPFLIIALIFGTVGVNFQTISLEYCGNVSENNRAVCYRNLAINAGDYETCFQIERSGVCPFLEVFYKLEKTNSIPDRACFDLEEKIKENYCFSGLGIIKKDPTICELIEDDLASKNTCIKGIVSRTGDFSLCEKITNKFDKESCLNPDNHRYLEKYLEQF